MLHCASIVSRKECLARITPGHHGYRGAPTPQAIVLHKISVDLTTFEGEMYLPLAQDWNTQGHVHPLSVHFVVTPTSAIQYAEVTDTTLGLDYLTQTTWPWLVHLFPLNDVNSPFIHIGLTDTNCLNSFLINLVCCIKRELQLDLPIVAASDLQGDRPELIIDPTFITQVNNCLATPVLNPPTIPDLQDQILEIAQCCLLNTAGLNALRGRVTNLEQTVADLKDRVTNVESNITSIFNTISILPAILTQLQTLQDAVAGILENCCDNGTTDQGCFNYRIGNGQEMVVTPNQPVWVNLPTKVIDTTPPLVIPGPLWKAKLLGTCNWPLHAIIRFRLNQWCRGKTAKLYLVACGQFYLLDEYTTVSDGTQVITLEGDFILPPGCSDVHLKVDTNDDTAQIIEFAEFRGCGCP